MRAVAAAASFLVTLAALVAAPASGSEARVAVPSSGRQGPPAGTAPPPAAQASAPAQRPPPWEGRLPPDSIRQGPVILRFWPEQRTLADVLARSISGSRSLPALPGDVLDDDVPVQVLLAPDAVRFDRLTGGRVPEWGAGVAFPSAGVIVLPTYESARGPTHDLRRVLRHELAHVGLTRFLSPVRPPRWFDEGYARWAAGEWNADAAWKLRLAFAMGRAPPLDSLALDWPRRAQEAEVAYLLAATTVGYLVDREGERALRIFLERWRDSGSLDQALRRTYGLTLSQFEEDWRREVKEDYGWAVFLSHSMVFWLFASLLLLVLYAIRRRRDRQRMERLRQTEPPDTPAYWHWEGGVPPPEGAEGAPSDEGGDGPHRTLGTGMS